MPPKHIIHMTKEFLNESRTLRTHPFNVLEKILRDGQVKGSDRRGYVYGTTKAACFTEIPPSDELVDVIKRRARNPLTDNYYGVILPIEFALQYGAQPTTDFNDLSLVGRMIKEGKEGDLWKFKYHGPTPFCSDSDWRFEREYRVPISADKEGLELPHKRYGILTKTDWDREYLALCFHLSHQDGFKSFPERIYTFEEFQRLGVLALPNLNSPVTNDMMYGLRLRYYGDQMFLEERCTEASPDEEIKFGDWSYLGEKSVSERETIFQDWVNNRLANKYYGGECSEAEKRVFEEAESYLMAVDAIERNKDRD